MRLRSWLAGADGAIKVMLVPQPILTQLLSEAGHALDLLLVGKDNT